MIGSGGQIDIPVRIFWKASSTLLASKAEVSIKDKLLSPAHNISQRVPIVGPTKCPVR